MTIHAEPSFEGLSLQKFDPDQSAGHPDSRTTGLTVPVASSIWPKRSHQSESLFKMIGEVPVVIAATHSDQK
jgi:hypothetical protein